MRDKTPRQSSSRTSRKSPSKSPSKQAPAASSSSGSQSRPVTRAQSKSPSKTPSKNVPPSPAPALACASVTTGSSRTRKSPSKSPSKSTFTMEEVHSEEDSETEEDFQDFIPRVYRQMAELNNRLLQNRTKLFNNDDSERVDAGSNNEIDNNSEDDDVPPTAFSDDDDDDSVGYNHFEADTRTRKTFTKRRYSNKNRIPVPLEGGFIRERLDESREELNASMARSSSVSPATQDNPRSDWHPGMMRPKISKSSSYVYKKLAELENELIQEEENRSIKEQQFLYGIVTSADPLESGTTFRLRIMDDSGKQDVPVRICTSAQDQKIGPKARLNDIIRIHRACVQFEGPEMVISTTPHHSYTLFNYQDDLIGNISIATCANSITFTEADKKRIIELREFLKKTITESTSVLNDSIIVHEPASQSQDDDGRSEGTGRAEQRELNDLDLVSSDAGNDNASTGENNEAEGHHDPRSDTSESSALIDSEIRTQSQGYGGEVNYDVTYPVDTTIVYETVNPDGCCFLEQLEKDQRIFNMKFWILKHVTIWDEDKLIIRVVDGTTSKYHRFAKLLADHEEETGIRNMKSSGIVNPEDYECAPAVDIEVVNVSDQKSKNHTLMSYLNWMTSDGSSRYVLNNISIVDQPGPFTRKYRNVKLVVDAVSTEFTRYQSDDKFSDMEVYAVKNRAKASTSRTVTIHPSSGHDHAVRGDDAAEESTSSDGLDGHAPMTRSRSRSMEHLGASEDASSSKRVRSLLASSTSSADTSSESDSQDSYHTALPGTQNIDPAAIGESQFLPDEVDGEVELVSAPTGANEPLFQDMDVGDADDDQQPLNPALVELDRQLGSSSNGVVLSPGPDSSGGGKGMPLSRSDNKKGSDRPPNIMENKSCDPKKWTLLKCWSKRMYDAFEAHRFAGYLEYSKRGLGKKFYTTIRGQQRKISIDDPEFQIFEILTLGELQDVGEVYKLQIEASEIQCANNMESGNPIPKWTLTSYLELAELLHKSLKVGDYFAVWGAKYTLKSKWVILNSFGAITVPETVMTIYRHEADDICDLVQELFPKPSPKTGEAQQVEQGSDNDNRLSDVDEGSDEDREPNQDNVNSPRSSQKPSTPAGEKTNTTNPKVIVADIPDKDTEEGKPNLPTAIL